MPYAQRTKEQYAYAEQATRGTNLMLGAKAGISQFGMLLFCYCVAAYKENPSKKRAIYIWETFLKDSFDSIGLDMMGSPTDIALTIDLPGNRNARWAWDQLRLEIQAAVQARTDAGRLGFAARVYSSSSRAMPPNLFDRIMENFLHVGTGQDCQSAWSDLANRLHENVVCAQSMYELVRSNLPGLQAELKANGFNLNSVGISSAIGLIR